MEKEKYFIPEIEDIYSGYEYEVRRNDGKWERVTKFSNDYDYEDNPHYAIMKDIKAGKIRVPYLSKEQIEKEGWEFTEQINNRLYFRKGAFVLTFEDDYINIDNTKGQDIGYWGKCKDINTFRYICKLLEI